MNGPPVSQQARRKERLRTWKKTVRQIATECWSSEQTPATGFVMLQLTYFYDSVEPDIDNIVKLIQDAIIVFAYADDDASLSE
ncbi:MAG: RusA family crossover junction endodeoxyribonuclease [Cyanobacteria bacterium P01_C01_bin.72]